MKRTFQCKALWCKLVSRIWSFFVFPPWEPVTRHVRLLDISGLPPSSWNTQPAGFRVYINHWESFFDIKRDYFSGKKWALSWNVTPSISGGISDIIFRMSGGVIMKGIDGPTCWKVSEFSDTSPEGLLPAMSGEPSCYWPNSYPFNDQRTKGPRYFTASENTTLKLSGWNFGSCFFCANDFPWKSSSKFSVHFFSFSFGADKLEAKKLRGPRTARILFISCYFKAIDAHFKLQSHLGYQQKKVHRILFSF